MTRSEAVTRGVRVQVQSMFVPERSNPQEHDWFFAYNVTITNEGTQTVQVLGRHWVITDSRGRIQEVEGEGVVGRQPVLAPGERFEYTSFCPLKSSFGTMHGTYRVTVEDGDTFDATIAPFALGEPDSIN